MTQTIKRIYDLTHRPISGWDIAELIAAEIDALARERDEGAEQYRASVAERVALRDQLAEARAEVERLRPAAEAWEAYTDWRRAPFNSKEEADAGDRWTAADKRARVAKVTP